MDKKSNTKQINYNFFHWGPFLYKTKLTEEEIQQLKSLCVKNKKHDYRKWLVGFIKHEYRINRKKVFPIILPYVRSYLQAALQHYDIRFGNKITLKSVWVNYMTKFESNPLHHHDQDLSFVLFTKIPELLEKEIEQTIGDEKPGTINFVSNLYSNKNQLNRHVFTPEVGDFFIFPSSLSHYVNSFQCEGERISISGNFSIK